MISTKIKCLCGVVFPFINYTDDSNGPIEFFDQDNIKEICQETIHDYRDEGHSGSATVELEDNNEYDDQLTEGKATCPSCHTSYDVKFGLVLSEYADIHISQKLEDILAPRSRPGTPKFGNQSVAENYVYNAELTRQNGKATLQCSVTHKIKFLD
jgi:hypothetical protein